jgi:hypothetical protein
MKVSKSANCFVHLHRWHISVMPVTRRADSPPGNAIGHPVTHRASSIVSCTQKVDQL